MLFLIGLAVFGGVGFYAYRKYGTKAAAVITNVEALGTKVAGKASVPPVAPPTGNGTKAG